MSRTPETSESDLWGPDGPSRDLGHIRGCGSFMGLGVFWHSYGQPRSMNDGSPDEKLGS